MTVGVFGEPATLDPYSPLASELTWELVRPVYPSLYRMQPDGSVIPDLAARGRPVAGGFEITLSRRRWSNGKRIEAADVVASVERARPPSGFALVRQARAASARRVILEGDVGDWPETLATVAFVLPRGIAGKASAGPFRISGRVPGLEISYRPDPRWPGTTGLEGFRVRFVVGTDMLVSLLDRGRLDVAHVPSALNLGARLLELELESADALGWELLYLDLSAAPPGLRAGLRKAVDRKALVNGFVRADGRISHTLHPAPGGSGADGPFAEERPERVDLAGTVQISAPLGDELAELVQRVVQIQLEEAGMTAELVTVDPETFYGEWAATDPFEIAVRRAGGAPGDRSSRGPGAIPIAQVETVAAWSAGVAGVEPNPTYEGLLWNVDAWSLTEGP